MNIPKFLSQSLQGSFLQNRKRDDYDNDNDDEGSGEDENLLVRQTNSNHNLQIYQDDKNTGIISL